jgi:FKBP-type peptidyl-prolyl cis-trans isomerase FklB
MKMKLVVAGMGLAITTAVAAVDAPVLSTDLDKLSYSVGIDLGKNLKKQDIVINPSVMAKGIEDGMRGGQFLMTDQQMKDSLTQFQKDLMTKRAAQLEQKSAINKQKGDAFLSQNKTKDGVVTLASGLQYKVITKGTGAKPGQNDEVTVEYTGKLLDGTVFDSTDKAGKPATFKVSQVIPGWTEALMLMPAGSTWEIYIPADLAYGARNVGGAIGPNETLIFNVHLISVKK